MNKKLKLYVISGCCGAGKSTLANELVKQMSKTALIHGDIIDDLYPEGSAPWEERLQLAWESILLLADNFLRRQINVIVDYVVEEELPRLLALAKKYNAKVWYVVMTAGEAVLRERLRARGDALLIERALFLRQKLMGAEHNKPYLYDGTGVPIEQQVRDVKNFKAYPA